MPISQGEGSFRNDEVDIAFKVSGSGPFLAFQSPGWGTGSGIYQETLRFLEQHFTVIHHDPRGSGNSGTPTDPEDINVGEFIDDLEAFRKYLGISTFALIGHSHGGFIAMNYALRYPGSLSHLIPLDAQLGDEEPGEDLARTLPERAADPRNADAVAAFMENPDFQEDADICRFLRRAAPLYFHDPDHPGVAILQNAFRGLQISLATYAAAISSVARFPVRDRLAEIKTPTLVLVGEHDFICSPVQASVIAGSVPGARSHVFGNSGHFPWLEEPASFLSTVVDFVSNA